MAGRSLGYSAVEIERLKTKVRDKVPFEQMETEFPGRSANGLKRKARELGFYGKTEVNLGNKLRNMAKLTRPLDPEEEDTIAFQDEQFQKAMSLAITQGLETAQVGIVTEPCTHYPKLMRAHSIIPRSSPAGDCADFGTVYRRTETAA